MNKVAEALKDWLKDQDDQNQIIQASCGNSYTAAQLIDEIESQTEVGQRLEKSIIALTIDLIFRKKEQI